MKGMLTIFIGLVVEISSILLGGKAINKFINPDKHPVWYVLLQATNGVIGFVLYLATIIGIAKIEEKKLEKK